MMYRMSAGGGSVVADVLSCILDSVRFDIYLGVTL
jgi:hypothetical protein